MDTVEIRYASNSSLTKHRECPQRWYYGHVRKLTKVESEDPAVERDFGSWWHMLRAADSIKRGVDLGSLQWMPDVLTCVDGGPELKAEGANPQLVFNLAMTWWEKQTTLVKDVWAERLGMELPDLLILQFNRWRKQWADQIAQERPLAVELGWERDLPSLKQPGGAVVDPHARLVGYIDEVYEDLRRHVIVCRDHKVSKRLDTQTTADDMMDSQLQLYAWGASPIVTAWGLGPIRATAYDRACMLPPRPPQLTLAGKLATRDGQPSVTSSDLDTYVKWAQGPLGQGVPWGEEGAYFVSGPRKGQPKFGFYTAEDAVIEKLSTPAAQSQWFQRTMTPLNPNLIRAHLRAAVDTSLDMGATYARAQIEHSAPRNLTGGNCRWCDFSKLCRAEMFGGPDGSYDLADFGLTQKGTGRR